MITSNVPSPSGSTQATATSHSQFSFFSNQPSSRYPIPPNLLPYDPLFPAYFPPVQQHVLPPTHPQGYLTTHAHAPSEFPYPPPTNPVQQYSVLPSHTNTPIRHQNPSLSYEQHPLPPLTGGPPHPYHHRLSSQPFSLYSSTDPNSVTTAAAATSHQSNPPDVHSLASQFSRMKTSSKNENYCFPWYKCTYRVHLRQHLYDSIFNTKPKVYSLFWPSIYTQTMKTHTQNGDL